MTRRRARIIYSLVCLLAMGLAGSPTVRADETERYSPPSRSGRAAAVAAVVRERARAHDVSPALLVALIDCEAGPDLDPAVVGDGGHSHGLAQLSDLPTGLLAHFHSLGYAHRLRRLGSGGLPEQNGGGGVRWRGGDAEAGGVATGG
jgi:hypothetical protein